MKTKLFRVLANNERQLAAVFEGPTNWQDARICAMTFAELELTDLVITSGKAQEPFPSRKVILCPGCRQPWRLCHLESRRQWGTKRCDCGTMFVIDWEFSGRELEITDIDSDSWHRYLASVERQVNRGATLSAQDIRGMEIAEGWLWAHKPGWKEKHGAAR